MPKKTDKKPATKLKAVKKVVKKTKEKVILPISAPVAEVFVTREGLKKLKEELNHLKTVRRKEVSGRLKEAISFGDLSENSEYEEAKNEQAFVEGRIIELEDKIKNARIISDKHSAKVVTLGAKVKIRSIKDKSEEEYTIVGTTESDSLNKLLSNESPIGAALIDREVGETIEVQVPAGKVRYKLLSIK
ncbi:transcription elongation factor GreA [Candidatus Peregrinibacteria bacterium]|jgi:transcription elongation factor GreA|nr:transcription elongation factor GreA [Candidatus Peregrinibacteria bacterium]